MDNRIVRSSRTHAILFFSVSLLKRDVGGGWARWKPFLVSLAVAYDRSLWGGYSEPHVLYLLTLSNCMLLPSQKQRRLSSSGGRWMKVRFSNDLYCSSTEQTSTVTQWLSEVPQLGVYISYYWRTVGRTCARLSYSEVLCLTGRTDGIQSWAVMGPLILYHRIARSATVWFYWVSIDSRCDRICLASASRR